MWEKFLNAGVSGLMCWRVNRYGQVKLETLLKKHKFISSVFLSALFMFTLFRHTCTFWNVHIYSRNCHGLKCLWTILFKICEESWVKLITSFVSVCFWRMVYISVILSIISNSIWKQSWHGTNFMPWNEASNRLFKLCLDISIVQFLKQIRYLTFLMLVLWYSS